MFNMAYSNAEGGGVFIVMDAGGMFNINNNFKIGPLFRWQLIFIEHDSGWGKNNSRSLSSVMLLGVSGRYYFHFFAPNLYSTLNISA